MSTVHAARGAGHLDWWEQAEEHPQFVDHFDSAQRRQMVHDDLFAGWSVSLLLASVVAVGTLVMAVTVAITLVT